MMCETNALNLGGTLILVDSIGVLEKVSVNMASAMPVGVVVEGAAEGLISE
jgi:hypothetical protein